MVRGIVRMRVVMIIIAVLAVGGLLAWHYQSRLIGMSAQWYLHRIAAQEERTGVLTRRRETIERVHRQLLIAPPREPLIPELYDLVTLLSSRVASGQIPLSWAAYLYTSYLRDAMLQRPGGQPRRATGEIQNWLDREVEFFYLRKRPDVEGVRLNDLLGDGESFTVEEIEEAYRKGVDLSAEQNGQ